MVLFLVICCASLAAAAAKPADRLTDSISPSTRPTIDPTTEAWAVINNPYSTGDVTDFRSAITAPSRGDTSLGPAIEYLKDYFRGTANDARHKEGEESRWSLSPSPGRLSLNPLTDIKNMVMLLQYRF